MSSRVVPTNIVDASSSSAAPSPLPSAAVPSQLIRPPSASPTSSSGNGGWSSISPRGRPTESNVVGSKNMIIANQTTATMVKKRTDSWGNHPLPSPVRPSLDALVSPEASPRTHDANVRAISLSTNALPGTVKDDVQGVSARSSRRRSYVDVGADDVDDGTKDQGLYMGRGSISGKREVLTGDDRALSPRSANYLSGGGGFSYRATTMDEDDQRDDALARERKDTAMLASLDAEKLRLDGDTVAASGPPSRRVMNADVVKPIDDDSDAVSHVFTAPDAPLTGRGGFTDRSIKQQQSIDDTNHESNHVVVMPGAIVDTHDDEQPETIAIASPSGSKNRRGEDIEMTDMLTNDTTSDATASIVAESSSTPIIPASKKKVGRSKKVGDSSIIAPAIDLAPALPSVTSPTAATRKPLRKKASIMTTPTIVQLPPFAIDPSTDAAGDDTAQTISPDTSTIEGVVAPAAVPAAVRARKSKPVAIPPDPDPVAKPRLSGASGKNRRLSSPVPPLALAIASKVSKVRDPVIEAIEAAEAEAIRAATAAGAPYLDELDDGSTLSSLPLSLATPRKSPRSADAQGEVARIKSSRNFAHEFDDLFLPTFDSAPGLAPSAPDPSDPDALEQPRARDVYANPLKARYDAVHALVDSESSGALYEVQDVELLTDLMSLGRLPLEDVDSYSALLSQERLIAENAAFKRHEHRQQALGHFAALLVRDFHAVASSNATEVEEAEHRLLLKVQLAQKEEQESFRRAQDQMEQELLREDGGVKVRMHDLADNAVVAREKLEQTREANQRRAVMEMRGVGGASRFAALTSHAPSSSISSSSLAAKFTSTRDVVADLYAKVRSRTFCIHWTLQPRLVRIRIDWIKSVKNKLAPGNYQIMVTLYDRLGGDALRWSGGGAEALGKMRQQQEDERIAKEIKEDEDAPLLSARASRGGLDPHELDSSRRPSSAASSAGKAKCFSSTGSTPIAQSHSGKFYHLDLCFNQKANRIFLACPPLALARPSMVMVFELFRCGDERGMLVVEPGDLASRVAATNTASVKPRTAVVVPAPTAYKSFATRRGPVPLAASAKLSLAAAALLRAAQTSLAAASLARTPPSSARVVAWGAFPLSHINFELVSGHFKLPLLRGQYGLGSEGTGGTGAGTGGIDKFQAIHERIGDSLDNWLGNLYFHVRHSGKIMDNATEYNVSLNFKGKKRSPANEGQADSSDDDELGDAGRSGVKVVDGKLVAIDPLAHQATLVAATIARQHAAKRAAEESVQSSRDGGGLGLSHRRGKSSAATDLLLRIKSLSSANGINAGIDESNDDGGSSNVTAIDRRLQVKFHSIYQPGLVVDAPEPAIPSSSFSSSNPASSPASSSLARNLMLDPCARYRYHVSLPTDSEEGDATQVSNPLGRKAAYKMAYIGGEIWHDLGIKRARDWQFLILLIIFGLWLRIYTHYLGQFLFLSSIFVPVSSFSCRLYTCDLLYVMDPTAVTAQIQIGVVSIGTVTNMITWGMFLAVMMIVQRVMGRAPAWTSRMMLGWGFGCVVEPFLILIIDCAQGQWYGDAFKLYQYYLSKDGNGVSGIFMTILIYLFLTTVSVVVFYHYIIYIHMNGRILDVHYRLHGDADMFILPADAEMSVRELRWILHQARRWVGMAGEKRKISLSKFNVTDPIMINNHNRSSSSSSSAPDLSLYIAIYTQSLDGDLELFRHFLRSPTGSICELFDSFDVPNEDQFARTMEQFQQQEARKKDQRGSRNVNGGNSNGGSVSPSGGIGPKMMRSRTGFGRTRPVLMGNGNGNRYRQSSMGGMSREQFESGGPMMGGGGAGGSPNPDSTSASLLGRERRDA